MTGGTQEMRQQILGLYLANSALTSGVRGWALYDGTWGGEVCEAGAHPEKPYETGLAALEAGWRLLCAAPLVPAAPGTEYATSHQKVEFFFEKLVPVLEAAAVGVTCEEDATTGRT
jgi:hypothetical protein